MSMQVLPTAPSPTVTHLMNLEALAAMDERLRRKKRKKERNPTRRYLKVTTEKRKDEETAKEKNSVPSAEKFNGGFYGCY